MCSSKAIRDMLPIIDPEEDYLTIVAAEEKIAVTEAKRKKELEEAHSNLKGKRCALLVQLVIFMLLGNYSALTSP